MIGVAHRAQARKPDAERTEAQQAFECCLRSAVHEFHPAFIVEEDNEEFLANRAEISISREVAAEASGVEHRFCEPNNKERSEIGSKNFSSIALELSMAESLSDEELNCKARAIEIARYFPIREQFWLKRLNDCHGADAILVCGDMHLESFGNLLRDDGIPYKVVKRGIGVNEADEPYYIALKYLEEHPGLKQWSP